MLRADKNSAFNLGRGREEEMGLANEQILQDEVSERDGEITRLVQEVARLRKELEIERSRKMVTIKPIIEEMEAFSAADTSSASDPAG